MQSQGNHKNFEDSNGTTLPSILAQASQHFQNENYERALELLSRISEKEVDDKETKEKIQHNIGISQYFIKHGSEPLRLLTLLERLSKRKGNDDKSDDLTFSYFLTEYNKAVLNWGMRQYGTAITILEGAFKKLENSETDFLTFRICFLLLELYITTKQSDKATTVATWLEKAAKPFIDQKKEEDRKQNAHANDQETDDETKSNEHYQASTLELKLNLHLNKAKIQLLSNSKSMNNSKREIKMAMTSAPSQSPTTIFLKSYLEYLRQNHKKALKLLNAGQNSTGDPLLPVLYYNNMGCIHYRIKKFNCALFYFSEALKINSQILSTGTSKSEPRNELNSRDKRMEIFYNTGLQLLFSGKPELAFDCFLESCALFFHSPKLWLRMGECCIAAYKKTKEENNIKEAIKETIGTNLQKKIILKTSASTSASNDDASSPTTEQKENGASALSDTSRMSLENAINYFRNAVILTDHNPSDAVAIRLSALLNLTYIHLCIQNPSVALSTINEFLVLSQESRTASQFTLLATIYKCEALCLLGRSREAARHLTPSLLVATPSTNTSQPSEPPLSPFCSSPYAVNDVYASTSTLARSVFYANLAVVHIMQDDLPQANQMLNIALSLNSNPNAYLLLQAYLEIRANNTEVAVDLLKKGRATLFPPSPASSTSSNTTGTPSTAPLTPMHQALPSLSMFPINGPHNAGPSSAFSLLSALPSSQTSLPQVLNKPAASRPKRT